MTEMVSYCPSQPKLSLQPENRQFACPTTKSSAELLEPASWPTSTTFGRRPAEYDNGLKWPPLPSERVTWTVVGKFKKKEEVEPPAESVVFC